MLLYFPTAHISLIRIKMTAMKPKKLISSSANPQFKQLKKIAHAAKERRKSQQTLLDGIHLIKSLAQHAQHPLALFVRQGVLNNHQEIASTLALFPDTTVTEITCGLFDAISPVENPTGILALYAINQPVSKPYQLGILLDRIQDPGNLGTLLRTVAAAGGEAVFLSKDCADAWAPKTLRAGMGAHFGLDIYENADIISAAQMFTTVIATSLQASQSLYETDLTGNLAFLFGNEGAGLPPTLINIANQKIKIPLPNTVESLNVAAACAVCLFERVRQLESQLS